MIEVVVDGEVGCCVIGCVVGEFYVVVYGDCVVVVMIVSFG